MTQTQAIINYLMPPGRSITPLEALNMFGCFRLGARMFEIKRMGYPVKSEIITDGKKRFAKYYL